MKFIARKGAPDIPLELIEAQENDELVFFCGAGVSYPSGLAGFNDLVEAVYQNLHQEKDEIEEQAIKAGFYDRALGLLEARTQIGNTTGINLVRKEIINELTLKPDANVATHKALLQLSKTRSGNYRLVTTNVDHGFLTAEGNAIKRSDSAPKLPVPKSHKWASVVHLHGLIDKEQDPNGEHLVFTSGDFGSAYLTERWASKFVTELFVNFTVVFVGYSLNDPVIRYMTDAIAADRRQDNKLFKDPYVIADTTNKKRLNAIKEWQAKGVEPVLYVKGGANHPNLHNSLQAWAAHARDGLSSKQRIIKSKARLAPRAPYDQDESIQQVLDTLKERVDNNHESVSGYPAKVFSELRDPPAPIEWLPLLQENGLLSISQIRKTIILICTNPVRNNLVMPNKISENIWKWLLHHLDKEILIRWVIDQGLCLHPLFKELVNWKLSSQPPIEPFLSFWKIVTSDHIYLGRTNQSNNYEVISKMTNGPDALTLLTFKKLLRPCYQITKAYYWGGEDIHDGNTQRKVFSTDVVLKIDQHEFKRLTKSDNYPKDYTDVLVTASEALLEAMELFANVGLANAKQDRSHWDIISIEPHPQNSNYKSFPILVELCRDLWKALFQSNESKARLILAIWNGYRFPIFRRLILNAYTSNDVIPADETIDYLLEDDGWWLWSSGMRREVYRLLNKAWPQASQNKAEILLNFIVNGPPRLKYVADLSDEEFHVRVNSERWVMLAKLQTFDRELFGEAQVLYKKLSLQYPKWSLSDGDRDEFTHWHSTSVGYDTDITLESLFSLPLPERVALLTEKNTKFNEGRNDVFRYAGKAQPNDVIDTLAYMFAHDDLHHKSWSAGLTGIAEHEENTWSKVAPMVAKLPDEFFREEAWAVAWWAKKAVTKVAPQSIDEAHLWNIASRLFELSGNSELETGEDFDAIDRAINDPVGIMTEAILDRLNLYKLESQDELPRPQPFELLDQLLDSDLLTLGRVILFSRLMYFYSVEPEWTQTKMITLLNFDTSNDAKYFWQGYLWNPRLSADLAIDLKEPMLQALEAKSLTGRNLEQLVSLFTLACLQYKDLYINKEIQQAFHSMGNEGLAYAVGFMESSVSYESEGRDNYWLNRINPLIRKAWPKGGSYLTQEIAQKFTLLLLQLDETFPEALNTVTPMLRPIDDMYLVLDRFNNSDVIEKYPEEAFQLLVKIFNNQNNWNNDLLENLMNRFGNVSPALKVTTEFIAISDFLVMSK
jgi:hypothetical protein